MPEVSQMPWWQRMWEPFWAIPLATSAGAVVLGVALPALDQVIWPWMPVLFDGGAAGARSVLGTVTTSMISVTGLVFSITMVVLQLASSQFSPRVLGSFLDSRITQATLGVFAATFLYALTVLRSVRNPIGDDPGFVPQLATGAAYVGVLASVAFFLAFIHHITTSIQVSHVVRRTKLATRRTLDRMIPEDQQDTATRGEPPQWEPSGGRPLDVPNDGEDLYLTDIDYRRLVDTAAKAGVVVTVTRRVGDFVPHGSALAQVWVDDEPEDVDALVDDVSGHLTLGTDRTLRQDVAFGIRQLVDIGERALSPGTNDPTTAAQVVDALHAVLRVLVQREVPNAHVTDDDGAVRLVYRPQTVEQHLALAVNELAYWGRSSLQIPPRLKALVDDLQTVSLPQYDGALADARREIERWEETS